MALCQELADGWQPRNGIERQLLDTMAQAQTVMLTWLTRLSQWSNQPPGPLSVLPNKSVLSDVPRRQGLRPALGLP